MSRMTQVDGRHAPGMLKEGTGATPELRKKMTSFVDSCVETVADSAVAAAREARHRPHAHKLLRVLKDKKNILITTHTHPDPDAIASSLALARLFKLNLPEAQVNIAVKGFMAGGLNAAFAQ